jgi:hypothetical protein
MVLGEDHPHTADSYERLGRCMNSMGRAAEAKALLDKAQAIRRRLAGK